MTIQEYKRTEILKNPIKFFNCTLKRYNQKYLLVDVNMANGDIILIDAINGGYVVEDNTGMLIKSGLFVAKELDKQKENLFSSHPVKYSYNN